jgi:hypothetical protein
VLHLRTTDEFAHWFQGLDAATAEDVAATLEVITQLGTEREAPGSSEWLTWYEHPQLTEHLRGFPSTRPAHPAILRFVHAWGELHGYAKRVVKHLESPAFTARLRQLEPLRAAEVIEAVTRIKKAVTKRSLALSDYYRRHRFFVGSPPSAAEEAELERFADAAEIREAYLCALSAAGFEVVDVPAHSPALREIALRAPPPGLRLLYGIDVPRQRGLVVLGERFDRSFYGDSVRRAEAQWRDFLSTETDAPRPPGGPRP